jgi:uncharacterized DUF497 family protein
MAAVTGFDWDKANRAKCEKHGVSVAEIESLFSRPVLVVPDRGHSQSEERIRAIGKKPKGPVHIHRLHHPRTWRQALHSADQRAIYAQKGSTPL